MLRILMLLEWFKPSDYTKQSRGLSLHDRERPLICIGISNPGTISYRSRALCGRTSNHNGEINQFHRADAVIFFWVGDEEEGWGGTNAGRGTGGDGIRIHLLTNLIPFPLVYTHTSSAPLFLLGPCLPSVLLLLVVANCRGKTNMGRRVNWLIVLTLLRVQSSVWAQSTHTVSNFPTLAYKDSSYLHIITTGFRWTILWTTNCGSTRGRHHRVLIRRRVSN